MLAFDPFDDSLWFGLVVCISAGVFLVGMAFAVIGIVSHPVWEYKRWKGKKMEERYKTAPNEKADRLLQFKCCDCGLVHKVGFTVRDDGTVGLTFERKPRSTAALRHNRVGDLFHPVSGDKWKIVRI